jgi:glycosyltransferase involved in cell wall biosynthesis
VSDSPETVVREGRIGLVPARFGEGMVGGAEIVLHQMARRLQDRGWDVEILTTTAMNHHTWESELPAGTSVSEDGLTVHRFPAVFQQTEERQKLEAAILAGHPISIADQQRWMNGGMRSPELFHHLLDHGDDYRALIFTPYPSWLAFACSALLPERSILWTCLHDEPYAYLELFQPMFTGVAGLLLQTEPEHALAHRVAELGPHALVGCGVEIPQSYDPDGFRKRYGIEGRFLLYAGRREGAKGWEVLLDQLARATERRDLPFSLVTMGGGDVNPPEWFKDKVIDVGFLPDDERDNAFAAADAYIQPSRYEAFSRTIMEAWLAGTLVIGNGGSEVVADHCARSGAGLVYEDELELEEALVFLAEAPEAAADIAANGRAYVIDNYRWEVVLDKVEDALSRWTAS